MTLSDVRVEIDSVDSKIKPLFLTRMVCAEHVADAKKATGGDVFVPEREKAIIEKRADDVDKGMRTEYVTFLKHLMSVSRRHQYMRLTDMQQQVLDAALAKAGLDAAQKHSKISIRFECSPAAGSLNLFVNMAELNGLPVLHMSVEMGADGVQQVEMTVGGSLDNAETRAFLCQVGKEAASFEISGLSE